MKHILLSNGVKVEVTSYIPSSAAFYSGGHLGGYGDWEPPEPAVISYEAWDSDGNEIPELDDVLLTELECRLEADTGE